MSTFLTILSGVTVFVIGQVALKLFIDPIHDFKKVIGEISNCLINNAGNYFEPEKLSVEKQGEVAKELLGLSAKLNAQMSTIPFYSKLARFYLCPSTDHVVIATKSLIGISNAMRCNRPNNGQLNCYSAQRVQDALGIHIAESQRLDPAHERTFLNGSDTPAPAGGSAINLERR